MQASFQSSGPKPFMIHLRIAAYQNQVIPDLQMYHYVGVTPTFLVEAVVHTTSIRSAESRGIFNERPCSHWRSRLRSTLSTFLRTRNEESGHEHLRRLNNRLLADIGPY